MKVNVASIIKDHWATLYDARTNRADYKDIVLFYVLPITAATTAFIMGISVKLDAYNVSITFFGIFVALLLNIQVALFSIFQRRWTPPTDRRQAEIQSEAFMARQRLLGELNSNISYLIVVSVIALVSVFTFFVEEWRTGLAPAFLVLLYLHFLLTFIMIVKRSHALFQKEYRDNPQQQ